MSLSQVAEIINRDIIQKKGEMKGASIDSIKRIIKNDEGLWNKFKKKGRKWIVQ